MLLFFLGKKYLTVKSMCSQIKESSWNINIVIVIEHNAEFIRHYEVIDDFPTLGLWINVFLKVISVNRKAKCLLQGQNSD